MKDKLTQERLEGYLNDLDLTFNEIQEIVKNIKNRMQFIESKSEFQLHVKDVNDLNQFSSALEKATNSQLHICSCIKMLVK